MSSFNKNTFVEAQSALGLDCIQAEKDLKTIETQILEAENVLKNLKAKQVELGVSYAQNCLHCGKKSHLMNSDTTYKNPQAHSIPTTLSITLPHQLLLVSKVVLAGRTIHPST